MDNLLILLLLRFKNIILKSMKYLKLYEEFGEKLVNLYRIEPEDWKQRTHPTHEKDPLLNDFDDYYFPFKSYGKWFEIDLERVLKSKTSLAPGTLFSDKLNFFIVQVPEKDLHKYSVKNFPDFVSWSKSPETEFIIDFDRDKTQKITFDNNESGWQKLNQELKKQ
jgi:hypothetical protein